MVNLFILNYQIYTSSKITPRYALTMIQEKGQFFFLICLKTINFSYEY